MTRKHFVLIAKALRENIIDEEQRGMLANAILPALRASNANFDSYRFMSAVMNNQGSKQ